MQNLLLTFYFPRL